MSLHYFIDAYNVLHSTNRWDHVPREGRREQFLQFLEEQRPTGSERNSVTVVFDGHGPRLGKVSLSLVQVVFSGDKDADTVIKEQVEEMTNPRSAVVVTNDRSIQKFVRGAGAKVIACEDFLNLKTVALERRGPGKLGTGTANAINAELSRIWKVK